MSEPHLSSVALIGVGLMGGSLGLAARERAGVGEVRGFSQTRETLELALARGAITHACGSLEEAVSGADLVVVCTPVRLVVEHVKAALADPGQAEVPVLTIALDAGFSSLGPFNRAFKTETGLTPTEYRRQHFEKSGDFKIGEPIPDSARPIPKSASTDLITP